MNELIPFTIEEMRSAKGETRELMKQRYHDWLIRQRKEDKYYINRLRNRKNSFHFRKRVLCRVNILDRLEYICFIDKTGKLREHIGVK